MLELQLEERPVGSSSQLTGVWNARLQSEQSARTGTVSGTVIGGVADVSLARVPRVECSPVLLPYAVLAGGYTFRASEQGGRLVGTVESWSCTGVTSGAVDLSR